MHFEKSVAFSISFLAIFGLSLLTATSPQISYGATPVETQSCSVLFQTEGAPTPPSVTTQRLTRQERLDIALTRSTPAMANLLMNVETMRDQQDAHLRTGDLQTPITIDLVQDQSHLMKAPPIPGFLLTLIARKAYAGKIKAALSETRRAGPTPRLVKMYFDKVPAEFNGVAATITAHTVIRLQRQDVPDVVDQFVESMYHPTLGNKVFKIDLL